MEKQKKIRVIVLILAALLLITAGALGGILISRQLAGSKQVTAGVSDNVIEPGTSPDTTAEGSSSNPDSQDADAELTQTPRQSQGSQTSATTSQKKVEDATLELYRNYSKDNTSFACVNWFPGDQETRDYCVRVTFQSKVTVHFKANVSAGSEKLAEVLKVRILLPDTNRVLYDGLMKDMPKSVATTLTGGSQKTTSDLNYAITAYLDTSVGNDYMEKHLSADFLWWVTDGENLESPDTSDPQSTIYLVLLIASGAVLVFVWLLWKRRKRA